MKRKHDISTLSRFLQRNPAWSQVLCVVGVALLIILGPIFLYGLLFQSGMDSVQMLFSVPWWPVVLLVALVALLSLLHGTMGVSVQKLSVKTKGDGEAADSTDGSDQSDRSDRSESTDPWDPASSGSPESSGPPGSPKPPGPPDQHGPPGRDADTVRCSMHEQSFNGLSRVGTNQ